MIESPFAKMNDFRFDIPAVYFETSSATVSDAYVKHIEELSKSIKPVEEFKITVFGYADSRGSEEFNAQLSKERAENVALLLRNGGISSKRIAIEGLGKRYASSTEMPGTLQLERKVIISITKDTVK